MDTALAVLPWILPPLLGAIIGYVTNRIAIKMLFRPLTAKRIFGIRVPLTPGVIPRNRFDLARTIGRMVSEQLLSPQALREQLEQVEFRSSITRWIGERRRTLMQQPISRPAVQEDNVPSADPERQESPFLDELMQQLLAAFLQSPQCARMVQSLAEQVTDGIGGKRISDITSAEQLAEFVRDNLLPALGNEELGNTASEFVSNWLRDQLNQNRRLKEYLTPENLEAVQQLLRNNMPTATWLVFNWLRQPDMSQKLAQIGQQWVEETVSHQGLLTRAILSLSGKKEEAIRDMPIIIGRLVDEAERSLSTPEMQDLVTEAVAVTLDRISGRRIKWLIGRNEQTIYWMADRATRGGICRFGRDLTCQRTRGGCQVLRQKLRVDTGGVCGAYPGSTDGRSIGHYRQPDDQLSHCAGDARTNNKPCPADRPEWRQRWRSGNPGIAGPDFRRNGRAAGPVPVRPADRLSQ